MNITPINRLKLKIKTKTLAEEARIIRKEEKKLTGSFKQSSRSILQCHRIWDVRNEARATHLALRFLLGKDYGSLEKVVIDTDKFDMYILPRVIKIAEKYAYSGTIEGINRSFREEVGAWLLQV